VDTATAIARRVGIALLAATLALVVSSFAWPAVLVLGDRVTSAGDAAVALLGCGLLVGLLSRVLAVVDRRRGRGRSVPDAEGARRARSGRRLAVVLLVVGAGAGAAFSWALDSGSTSAVLAPARANGCRVVVEEHSFLMGGSGSVFVLPAGAVVARRVSRYSTDDGYRPVEAGSFALSWAGERGHLEVSGSGFDPVWPRSHEVVCRGG
jgi:hypothetical protein